jgi:hypothetical protein
VARRFEYLDAHAAKIDGAAVADGREAVFRDGFPPEVYRRADAVAELQMSRNEVRVEVCEENVGDAQSVFGGEVEVLIDVALRIDDRGSAGGFIADDVRSVRQAVQIELFENH